MVVWYLVMPHVRHVHLGLHIGASLKGKTASIWSFGYGFACTTTMECAGIELLFYIFFFIAIDYFKKKTRN